MSIPSRGSRHGRSRRRPRPASSLTVSVETLEPRALLALSVTAIAPVQGAAFRGQVATFQVGDVLATNILDYKASVLWGDGTSEESGNVLRLADGRFQITGEHIYKTEGTYNLSVVLQGLSASKLTAVGSATVGDATPDLLATGIAPVAGARFELDVATFTDPGPDAPNRYEATIDWGDGTPASRGSIALAGGKFSIGGAHTFAAPGSTTYKVTLTTAGGTSVTAVGQARVADPSPSVTVPAVVFSSGLTQSRTLANFIDLNPNLSPTDFAAIITWGDGSPDTAASIVRSAEGPGFSVVATHRYASSGLHDGQIRLTRLPDANVQVLNSRIQVANPVLTGQARSIAPSTGLPFRGAVATFADNNPDAIPGDFAATIDWGDGTAPTQGTVAFSPGNGGFTVSGTHSYAVGDRSYPIRVRVLRVENQATLNLAGVATVSDARLSLATQDIKAEAGREFRLPIATISDTFGSALSSDYTVRVDWGDGTVSSNQPGGDLVLSSIQGNTPAFSIVGRHLYNAAGGPAVSIRVERGGESVAARSIASVAVSAVAITTFPTDLVTTAGAPLRDVNVGHFTTSIPAKAADFAATIDWGDGVTSEGSIVERGGAFAVTGSHTYTATSSSGFLVRTSITRPFSGSAPTAIQSKAIVLAPAFTGRLAASSDSGISDRDGITAASRPDFAGTATPYSVVRIEAIRETGADPIDLGSAAAAADGSWLVHSSDTLPDGTYQVRTTQIPPAGAPVTTTILPALVIDTVAPKVTGLAFTRKSGSLIVTFRDSLSGMAERGLLNHANFNLLGTGIARPGTSLPPEPVITSVLPGDLHAVRVKLNIGTIRSGLKRLRILSEGITDVAGNSLDGEYAGRLPTGNGRPGGDLIWKLTPTKRMRSSTVRRNRLS